MEGEPDDCFGVHFWVSNHLRQPAIRSLCTPSITTIATLSCMSDVFHVQSPYITKHVTLSCVPVV